MFEDRPETAKTGAERWVRVFPDDGDGFKLYDPMREAYLGRILFDKDDNWIYDGEFLDVYEQEDVAGFITGNQKEMNELINGIREW